MCRYDPDCTKPDDDVAEALSRSPRENDAILLIICPPKRHLLAAVYDLPDRGPVLCSPHHKFRHGSLFASPTDPEAMGHFHAALEPLSDLRPEDVLYGRCRCGTWCYSSRGIDHVLLAWSDEQQEIRRQMGVPLAGDEELLKIRWPNGQVSTGGRAMAESVEGAEIVGTVNSKRNKRPHLVGSWVTPADLAARNVGGSLPQD